MRVHVQPPTPAPTPLSRPAGCCPQHRPQQAPDEAPLPPQLLEMAQTALCLVLSCAMACLEGGRAAVPLQLCRPGPFMPAKCTLSGMRFLSPALDMVPAGLTVAPSPRAAPRPALAAAVASGGIAASAHASRTCFRWLQPLLRSTQIRGMAAAVAATPLVLPGAAGYCDMAHPSARPAIASLLAHLRALPGPGYGPPPGRSDCLLRRLLFALVALRDEQLSTEAVTLLLLLLYEVDCKYTAGAPRVVTLQVCLYLAPSALFWGGGQHWHAAPASSPCALSSRRSPTYPTTTGPRARSLPPARLLPAHAGHHRHRARRRQAADARA